MAPPKGLKDTFSTKKIGSRTGKGIIAGVAVIMALGHMPGFDEAGAVIALGNAMYEWVLVLGAGAAAFWKEGE